MRYCQFCGSIVGEGDKECIRCGNTFLFSDIPVDDSGQSRSELTLSYDAYRYLIVSKMHVTILGKEYVLSNHEKIKITLQNGKYDLLFKSGLHNSRHLLSLQNDVELKIGWNRFTGCITFKECGNDRQ